MDLSKIIEFAKNILTNQTKEYFDNTSDDSTSNYNLPIKYSDFPVYNGKKTKGPIETTGPNYTRLTIFYKGVPNPEYYLKLQNFGYEKTSDVRFDKDNTYVIVEQLGRSTKIAYHIKN